MAWVSKVQCNAPKRFFGCHLRVTVLASKPESLGVIVLQNQSRLPQKRKKLAWFVGNSVFVASFFSLFFLCVFLVPVNIAVTIHPNSTKLLQWPTKGGKFTWLYPALLPLRLFMWLRLGSSGGIRSISLPLSPASQLTAVLKSSATNIEQQELYFKLINYSKKYPIEGLQLNTWLKTS